MQPTKHFQNPHLHFPSLPNLHRSPTTPNFTSEAGSPSSPRDVAGSSTGRERAAVKETLRTDQDEESQSQESSQGDQTVMREYEETRDRLSKAIESSLYLLADLRTFNEKEWVVRYPSFKVPASSSAKQTDNETSSNSSDGERATARKRTMTMTFVDDPTTAQEVTLSASTPTNSTSTIGGQDIACKDDTPKTVTRKTMRRSLTFAPQPSPNAALSQAETDEMTDFSILRLDLSMGHAGGVGSQALISQTDRIMSSLERNSISRLLSSRLESSMSHLKALQGRIMSTRSRVLVTGDLNAGKSTFVNAVLRRGGKDEFGWPTGVLPVDQQPLTGRFVEVFGEDERAEEEMVHVVKQGKEEQEYDPTDESTFEKRKLDDLLELVADQKAEEPPLKVYLRSPSKDLTNPSILHNGILDISLIDAPGLNRDVIQTTSTFTRSPTIDVVIFVVSAANHFTLSAKEFILSAGQEKARMFIVVNRFDEVRDKERCRRVVLEQIRQLSPKTWEEREELVHFVDSAKVALRCSEEADLVKGDQKADELDEAFKKLESSLRSFVLINRAKSKLGPAENYLCHLLADVELLSSANAVVAEDARDKAREEKERVRPGLEAMLRGSAALEEGLSEEEELIGGRVDAKVKQGLGEALVKIGNGQPAVGTSMPPYPGLLGVWDYAVEVRKTLLRSVEAAVLRLEQDTRKVTTESVQTVIDLGDKHLPSDVERSKRIFNPQAMFANTVQHLGGNKRASVASVGLGLTERSELCSVSLADIFDVHHYVLSVKSTFTGSSASGEDHGELTVLGMASLAAGAVTMFGGKALGFKHVMDSLVSVTEILGDRASRKWATPVIGALALGLTVYIVQDLPSAIPRNVGRAIEATLRSEQAALFISGDDGSYIDAQSSRMQREARKVVRLASWDLRERFRTALEAKNKVVRESEAEERKAGIALEYFVESQKRVLDIKVQMGKSVFA